MKTRSVAVVMTVLSLAAAALLVAAADVTDVDVIRLPSDGGEGLDAGQPGAAEPTTRPWKCCDVSVCTKSYPPSCLCLDKVERCDEACASCVVASESDPSRRVCNDRYRGDLGPRCTASKDGSEDDEEGAAAADAGEERKEEDEEDAAAAKDKGGDVVETRPWPCCNNTLCTKSYPPTCSCLDVVEVCAGGCQRCEPSGLRHVCKDQYHGDPGPKCAKDDDDDVPSGASRPVAAAAGLLLAFVALLFIQSR